MHLARSSSPTPRDFSAWGRYHPHRTPVESRHTISEPHVSLRPIRTDKAPQAIGPYSQGVVAGGFLFTPGQIALDPATTQVVAGDVKVQTERVLANLAEVLAAAGASWRHVVKTTV